MHNRASRVAPAWRGGGTPAPRSKIEAIGGRLRRASLAPGQGARGAPAGAWGRPCRSLPRAAGAASGCRAAQRKGPCRAAGGGGGGAGGRRGCCRCCYCYGLPPRASRPSSSTRRYGGAARPRCAPKCWRCAGRPGSARPRACCAPPRDMAAAAPCLQADPARRMRLLLGPHPRGGAGRHARAAPPPRRARAVPRRQFGRRESRAPSNNV